MPQSALSHQRRGRLATDRYALCLGAGIGKGLFPDWAELTRRVLERVFARPWTDSEFKQALEESRWSLDSWIQLAENQYAKTTGVPPFAEVLAECLYEDVAAIFRKHDLASSLAVGLHHPQRLTRDEVYGINSVLTDELSRTTLMQVVDALVLAEERKRLPEAIITLNADSFLYLALWVRKKILLWQNGRDGDNPSPFCSRVYRGIDFGRGPLPLVHCHGALLPNLPPDRGIPAHRVHLQRLIFSESSYLRLAADMSSWATTMFLFYAQTCRMLFIGLSFSDPNLRRWLNWSHLGTTGELADFTSRTVAPRHILLAREGSSPAFDNLRDVGLQHLGVELDTVPSWNDLADGIKNLLAV